MKRTEDLSFLETAVDQPCTRCTQKRDKYVDRAVVNRRGNSRVFVPTTRVMRGTVPRKVHTRSKLVLYKSVSEISQTRSALRVSQSCAIYVVDRFRRVCRRCVARPRAKRRANAVACFASQKAGRTRSIVDSARAISARGCRDRSAWQAYYILR